MTEYKATLLVTSAISLAATMLPVRDAEPLNVARILVTRCPTEVSIRYIPGLMWAGALRLTSLTGETRWRDKARREMEPFVSGRDTRLQRRHAARRVPVDRRRPREGTLLEPAGDQRA
jgi:hypothetical protein